MLRPTWLSYSCSCERPECSWALVGKALFVLAGVSRAAVVSPNCPPAICCGCRAGFATSFHILHRRDQEKHDNFSSIGKSMMTMVTWLAGNADLNPLYEDSSNPVAASLLGVLFVFSLATVLMNLLISIMTNTLEKVTENEGLRMLLSKAQAIDELESTIPSFVERWSPGLFPRFLHVLRVDPDKLDTVRLDQLWNKSGDDERDELLEPDKEPKEGDEGDRAQSASGSKSGASAAGASASAAGLEAKVDAVQAELAEIKKMLLELQPKAVGSAELPNRRTTPS